MAGPSTIFSSIRRSCTRNRATSSATRVNSLTTSNFNTLLSQLPVHFQCIFFFCFAFDHQHPTASAQSISFFLDHFLPLTFLSTLPLTLALLSSRSSFSFHQRTKTAHLWIHFFPPTKINEARVTSLTASRTLTCAREHHELNCGAHEPQPACPMGALGRGSVNGVDGAAAEFQLTVRE